MSYLFLQKSNNLQWVEEVGSKGRIWATPGAYLRKKMLLSLARRVSDHFLPEAFYEKITFDDSADSPTLPKDQEQALEISLQEKMEDCAVQGEDQSEASEEEDSD